MSRICLATSSATFEHQLRQAFSATLNGSLRRVPALSADIAVAFKEVAGERGNGTEVVALGPDIDIEMAMALAQRLDIDRPEISVVLIADPSPALLERALRVGIRDVLSPTATLPDVHSAFERAMDVAERRRTPLGQSSHQTTGRVITVVSPKGGSGKTTTCTNLAVGLALAHPGQVALVDLDLQFGDVASALQLDSETTLSDLSRATTLEDAAVKVALTSHASGLYVLCAPDSPAEAEDIPMATITQTLNILAEQFRFVIVDTDAGLSEHALTALEASTDIVLLCSMDVPSIRGLRKEINVLDQLEMTRARRHFVINRSDSRVGLAIGDIEAIVQLPVDVALPSSRSVPLSMNQGSPVIESDPRSAIARQFAVLVDRFADRPEARPSNRLWRRSKDAR